MQRDLSALSSQIFDVIVVGAGIYGATITRSLAEAGFRVLVIDKGDFCSATSANSLKILHGGLRYLQHADIKRMRETIVSRRELMRFSPHLVAPLACLIPTAGHGFRSRPVMALASVFNNLISADRNQQMHAAIKIPAGHIVTGDELLRAIPGYAQEGLSGGVVWHDGLALNSERLVLEHILAACDCGASACNYLQADTIVTAGNRVAGIQVTDQVGGEACLLQTRWIVNAAGPWFDDLLNRSGIAAPPTRWAKAVNIVVSKPLHGPYAVGLEGQAGYEDKDALVKRGKRFFFFVPWRGGTMIGTTYHAYTGDKDSLAVTPHDLDEILAEVTGIYPAWRLARQDITMVHGGLLPMSDTHASDDGKVQLAKDSLLIDHGRQGGPKGLLSLRSIKYTTAPVEAKKITALIQKQDHRQKLPAQANLVQQPANDSGDRAIAPSLREYLTGRYGRWASRVWRYVDGGKPEHWWLCREPDLLHAELVYFVREESAQTLADVVFRRTGLGTLQCPTAKVLDCMARAMAALLGWNEERIDHEIQRVYAAYGPVVQQAVHPEQEGLRCR